MGTKAEGGVTLSLSAEDRALLERVATGLENMGAVVGSALEAEASTAAEEKPAPKASKSTKAKEPEEKPDEDDGAGGDEEEKSEHTLEEVRQALKDYSALEGRDAAIAILKENGASAVSDLKPSQFAAIIAATS